MVNSGVTHKLPIKDFYTNFGLLFHYIATSYEIVQPAPECKL